MARLPALLCAGVALCAAASSDVAASSSSACLPAPYDAVCLSWKVLGKNISFTGTWPSLSGAAINWGAWGISSISCGSIGSMFPSSIWMAIVGPAGVALEDRFAVAHAVPQCRKQQLSHVTSSHVAADGSFTVTWTRPLVPAHASGQPSIVPGNVSLIGAFYTGASLDLRPCEPSGIPIHSAAAATTVQLLAQAAHADEPSGPAAAAGHAAAPPAAAGLVAAQTVCINPDTGTSSTTLAALTASGVESFYGGAGAVSLTPGVTALDPAGRALYSLVADALGVSFNLVSLDVDTGSVGVVCKTSIPVPTVDELENLNVAWDSNNASIIVAACTDTVCAGYVQVSRIDPSSCALTPVCKVPTDPASVAAFGAAAFDATTNLLVMSASQTVKGGSPGLALVAVDMESGAVRHVFNEAGSGRNVVALVRRSDAPGVFWGLDAPGGSFNVSLVQYDAVHNTLTRAPPIAGAHNGALQGSAALGQDGILYFLAPNSAILGVTSILGVHTANGTLASAGALPGDAPSALVFL